MWNDRHEPLSDNLPNGPDMWFQSYLRCEKSFWNQLIKRLVKAKLNMVVIDLGDAVRYESHPEIAVKKAWTVEKLRKELEKIRSLGLEPIPKMNFSTSHDAWLGEYAHRVSTPEYYAVCRDLIKEVVEIFDHPRLFHIGMDEECAFHQKRLRYICCRQYDLWWRDLYFLVDQVEKGGSRAWIWSDAMWANDPWSPGPEFFKKMPKSVVQTNWLYGEKFTVKSDPPNIVRKKKEKSIGGCFQLAEKGYDQIACGSNYYHSTNFESLVKYLTSQLNSTGFLGFLQTTWCPTMSAYARRHVEAIEQVERAKNATSFGHVA